MSHSQEERLKGQIELINKKVERYKSMNDHDLLANIAALLDTIAVTNLFIEMEGLEGVAFHISNTLYNLKMEGIKVVGNIEVDNYKGRPLLVTERR